MPAGNNFATSFVNYLLCYLTIIESAGAYTKSPNKSIIVAPDQYNKWQNEHLEYVLMAHKSKDLDIYMNWNELHKD